ncbi:MAG: ATP synthase A1 subunit C [Halobacteriales archaeon]|nr:ATP synthase A1 subunit C [Halobacteriales archaeon]
MPGLRAFRWKLLRGNYPYVTARVKAKKPKLLRRDDYNKLISSSPAEMARFLQEGTYKREVDELSAKYRGARLVEMSTRLSLSRSYTDVASYATGELQRLILLYLQRYDVYNIKTLVRGKLAGVGDEEIEQQLIPAGALRADQLSQLAKLGNLDEVIERLGKTLYAPLLREGLEGGKRENLARVENELDKLYYRTLLNAVDGVTEPKRAFLNFVRLETALLDLKTVLRLRAGGVEDAAPYLVNPESGLLDAALAARLLRASPEEMASEVEASGIGKEAGPVVRQYLADQDLNRAVIALDQALLRSAAGFSRRYPLSLLPVVDFVLRKRIEVDNLRIIAAGREHGLPEDTIRGLLSQ